jgi:hypothetical protein
MLQTLHIRSRSIRNVALAWCSPVRCYSECDESFLVDQQLIVLRLAKNRSHIIYTDTGLNGLHTAYVNVYQNSIICALKMHHYLMSWGINVAKNAKFLHGRFNLI